MNDATAGEPEDRVLVLAPTSRDGATSRTILSEAGIPCSVCTDADALRREIEVGAAAAILTEEAATSPAARGLVEFLARQPAWSDFPMIVLTRGGADSAEARQALEVLGNVTLLERPVRVLTLVSTVRTALRARKRQYQIRAHLEERMRAEEAFKEADRRKDEFLAMLAHELRNPLSAVNNAIAISRRSESPADLEWSQDVLERQVQHLARLIDDLMDVSRINRGKIQLRKVPLDVAAAVPRAVEVAMALIHQRGHELRVSLAPDLPMIEADPTRFEQVLTNLLTNAAKYTEEGGRIDLTARRDGGHVVIEVRDTGVGIPTEMLSHVFDLFTQGDRSIDRSQGGLGIGLTVVQKLVQMHGGTVSAWSEGPGRGSTFTLAFPAVARRQAPASLPPGPRGETRPAGSKILVVDDNVDSARGLARLLSLMGHDVRLAHDGPAALLAAREHRPSVVLLDIGLPEMNGYQVAAQLRKEHGPDGLLLIAITGYGEDEAHRRSAAAGFDHHLVKPLNIETVLELISGRHAAAKNVAR